MRRKGNNFVRGVFFRRWKKYTLWKILCPYLVNIKKLEYEGCFKILKTWLEKCNHLRKLDSIQIQKSKLN